MALSATCVFEVRPSGSDTNGGFFDPGVGAPGTDFSVQDAAQTAYTDLVIDGADNTIITSVAFPFGATHPGNAINITGGVGFTPGWYEVLSVTGVKAKLDRAVGVVGSTGGTGNLGGGFATPGQAASLWVTSNTIFVKGTGNAVYTMTNSANVSGGFINYTGAGTNVAPNQIIGYDTTRTTTNNDTTRPTFQATATINGLFRNETGLQVYIRNLILDANGNAGYGLWFDDAPNMAENCKATGNFTVGFFNNFSQATFFNCLATGCVTGFQLREFDSACIACVATACTGSGFDNTSGVSGGRFLFCIAFANNGYGWNATNVNVHCYHCVSQGNKNVGITHHGYGFVVNDRATLINCIASDNDQNGFQIFDGVKYFQSHLYNCAGWNNTAGDTDGNFVNKGFITLTGDPFTNTAGANFTLNNVTGAGGACRNAGFIASYPGVSTTSFFDIGASQHRDVAGTYVTVTSNHQPATPGQSVTFTATVTVVGGGTATGTVQFAIDGVNFGAPVALAAGVATSGATTTLATGTRTITATYTPSGAFQSSVGTLYQVVQIAATVLPVGRLFRTNWTTDPVGFAQELAALVSKDSSLSNAVNVLRDVLPEVF